MIEGGVGAYWKPKNREKFTDNPKTARNFITIRNQKTEIKALVIFRLSLFVT